MYEVALLKLLALVCHGCSFEINDTGNGFKFKPGIVMGGSKLEHDCDVERSIWYFLEPLILLGLFARKPITITLKGTCCSRSLSALPSDVRIFTDHRVGPQAGVSHGYGTSLVAETTSGCHISADTTISHARGEQISEVDSEKKELVPPKDVGLKIASVLLGEIGQGGVVDSNLQNHHTIGQ
ncbi:RNA cyclase family protein [Prunus dulcis]|uniref:RNA cyclase family protein n=1 Tax=Prunus dulcis TaxID=3755 RepID=A0A4Y1RLA9_PRUDU|nr:RNA cyclase family protein [Prunus dulcis]